LALALRVTEARAQAPVTLATTPVEATPSPGQREAAEARAEEEATRMYPDRRSPGSGTAAPGSTGDETEGDRRPGVQFHGFLDAYYAYNFNEPSNNVTALRAYDARHNQFALGNAVLTGSFRVGRVSGHLGLQFGPFSDVFLASTRALGLGFLGGLFQEGSLSWEAPVGRGLRVDAGLFAIPFGPEEIAAYRNWNYSHSLLFAYAPYQQVGARAVYTVAPRARLALGVYNGWNQVTRDNNRYKSVSAEFTWHGERVFFDVEYYLGVERERDAPEGPYARHTLDSYVSWEASPAVSVMAHMNTGFEPNRVGTQGWFGLALYARFRLRPWLFFATRLEAFTENTPPVVLDGPSPRAVFQPQASWAGGGTFTLDARPHEHVSFRLEYRHDLANGMVYFRDGVTLDLFGRGAPNAGLQDTILLGATAWF
jgi:hypothetical protein